MLYRKCDAGKPICQNCEKAHRICVATTAVNDVCFSINEENDFASGAKKRPRGPRSNLVTLRPRLDLQTLALAHYFRYHIKALPDVPDIFGGMSECIHTWRCSEKVSPMVDLALSAVALAVFARAQRFEQGFSYASTKYHQLLQTARQQIMELQARGITDPSDVESCLLTALLMCRYEGVSRASGTLSHDNSIASLRSWSHFDGVLALLKIWSVNKGGFFATSIIKQARRQIIKLSLLRKRTLPDWLLDGRDFGESGVVELEYDRALVKMVVLRHRLSVSQQDQNFSIETTSELISEAQNVDRDLQSWMASVAITHPYRQHELDAVRTHDRLSKHFYSQTNYSYASPEWAAVWLDLYAVRLLITDARLRWLRQISSRFSQPESGVDEEQSCQEVINRTVDKMAYSVPYVTERFHCTTANITADDCSIKLNKDENIAPYLVNWISWPLAVASSLPSVDEKQRLWFKSELGEYGKMIGDRVLERAGSQQWIEL